jgi:hypothetical protein
VAPPTPIQHAEVSDWTTITTPKTVSVTVAAGDIITVLSASSDNDTLNTPTNDGAALTWTPTAVFTSAGNSCYTRGYTATADSGRTIVISQTRNAVTTDDRWGFFADVWRASDGVGASNGVNIDTTANYSCTVTTTQANSALVGISPDWGAVNGARTYTAINGIAFVIETGAFTSGQYYVSGGYDPDVGAIGTKTPEISAPAAETVTMCFIEVKGSVAAPPSFPSIPRRMPLGV